jgi:hypothetical protein
MAIQTQSFAQRRPFNTISPNIDRGSLAGKAAVEQMVDDLRNYAAVHGNVTRDDLSLLGWSGTQIDTHIVKAREAANKRSEQ